MSISETERLSDVWREVCQWPPPARLSLAARILQSLEAESAGPSVEQRTLSDLIGAWRTDQPADDKAIERILDEERMRKHG
jgi:hypothetical protein